MQILKQLYRSSYSGENVVTQLTYENGEWTPETEAVQNSVFNTPTSSQAVAIASGATRSNFELNFIATHKGGLFGADRLQSYGCNGLYKEFAPDFLIAVGDDHIEELAASDYPNDNIVYAHAQSVLQYPGKFYLIPQNIAYDAGAIAAYMACFDGHKKVFLLGYDSYVDDHESHPNQTFFIKTLASVVKTYSDVDFVRVMPTTTYSCDTTLSSLINFRQITYRDFVLEADIG